MLEKVGCVVLLALVLVPLLQLLVNAPGLAAGLLHSVSLFIACYLLAKVFVLLYKKWRGGL